MSARKPPMTDRKKRILAHLDRWHAITVPEIADDLGEPISSVRTAVRRLVQAGLVDELGESKTGARCFGLHREPA